MIITKIDMENYRGFFGAHSIDLVETSKVGSHRIGKLNVLTANNTVGKSTIFNAISWCLFGTEDHLISKSGETKKEPIINTKALRKGAGVDVGVSVKIHLKSDDISAMIERKTVGRDIGEGKSSIFSQSELSCTYVNTESASKDKSSHTCRGGDAEFFVQQHILDKDIRQFFLIDGEKLRDFFFETTGQALRNSIMKVTEVEYIKNVLDQVKKLSKENSKHLKNDPELASAVEKRENLEAYIGDRKNELDNIKSTIYTAQEKVKIIHSQIESSKNQEYTDLDRDRTRLEEERHNHEIQIEKIDEKIEENILKNAFAYILKNEYDECIVCIDAHKEKNLIPPLISEPLMESVLQTGKCICGTHFSKGSKQETELLHYFKKSKYSGLKGAPLEGKGILTQFSTRANDYKKINKEQIKSRRDHETRVTVILKDLKSIDEKIAKIGKSYSPEEIDEKEKTRRIMSDSIDKYLIDRGKLEQEISQKTKYLDEAKRELENAKELDKKNQTLKRYDTVCSESIAILSDMEKDIENMIRKELEDKIKNRFFSTGTREVTGDIGKISIDEDFGIDIRKKDGYPCLHSMSAGQSLVFTLAVATSLREMSRYEFPLIIDTPTAKLDPENEIAVLSIPKTYSDLQLVLLLILDKEYTERIRKSIKVSISTEHLLTKDDNGIKVNSVESKSWSDIKNLAGRGESNA